MIDQTANVTETEGAQATVNFADGTCLKVEVPALKVDPTTIQTLIFDKDKFSTAEAAKEWAVEHDFDAPKIDETGESYRLRQRDPEDFKPTSFRTITLTDGVKAVVGKLRKTTKTKAAVVVDPPQPQPAEKCDFEHVGRILKGEEPDGARLHYVLNVVLEPNPPEEGVTNDTQGDTYTKADIWEAQRSFQSEKVVGLRHRDIAKGATILHDWITPLEFEFGGQVVKEGSWLLGVEVDEDDPDGAALWADIASDAISAFSIGGVGERVPLE